MSILDINRISIILEVISFFFVTLDLYGTERLVAAEKRFREIFEHARKEESALKTVSKYAVPVIRTFQNAGNDLLGKKYANQIGGTISTLMIIIGLILVYDWYPELNNAGILGFFFAVFLAMFVAIFMILLIIITLLIFSSIIFYILEGSLIIAHLLLIRLHLSGILVTIGTVFFLASKIITFIYY